MFSGGTFDQLVAASGCPVSKAVFWFTVSGAFVPFVPGSSVGAVNTGAQAAFPASLIPPDTALIGRCVPAGQQPVTLADDGGTLTLHVGDTFLLTLGDTYGWNVQVGDPSIISRVVNIAVIRGSQGVYRANALGTTILTATPMFINCPPNAYCVPAVPVFHVTLVVQ